MKKIIIFFFILFLLPFTLAVEVDMKSEYDQGETMIARISGNFLDNIQFENIFFYRGHVRVPFLYDVTKINNEFYIYALMPQAQNNYSIVIKDVRYMGGSQITDDEIIKNFSVSDKKADFSVYPGFIVTNKDFFIKIQNLQNQKIDINLALSLFESEESITFLSGEIKKIYFSIKNLTQSTFEIIDLSTENLQYEIPVYVFGVEEENGGEECIPDCADRECGDDGCGGSCGTCEFKSCVNGICVIEKIFRFSPSEIDISIPTNYNKTKIIYLSNLGQNDLEDISLSISKDLEPYVSFSIDEIEKLDAGSNIKIKLFFFSEEEISLDGEIVAEADDEYGSLLLTLNFLKDYEPLEEEDEYEFTTKTCSEMGGLICTLDEECDRELIDTKDDKCCLGNCKEIKKSSTGKIIGWTMVVLVSMFLIWFLKTKYKGAKKTVDLLKIGNGKK